MLLMIALAIRFLLRATIVIVATIAIIGLAHAFLPLTGTAFTVAITAAITLCAVALAVALAKDFKKA